MITYMRTDGLQMSAEAVEEIRATVQGLLGPQYLPKAPRAYKCACACPHDHGSPVVCCLDLPHGTHHEHTGYFGW